MLATAYTLAQGIRAAGGADLVICGKQTTDGDTAQVGAELAEFLGIPHVAGVSRIHELSDEEILLDLDLPLHVKTVRVKLPCLVCVEKGIYEPRLPSFRRKLETAGRPVRTFTVDDMEDPAPEHYGLSGSPTQVKRIFPPENTNTHESWEGSGDELAERLRRFLDDRKFLQQLR